MTGNFRQQIENYIYWDTDGSGANPIAPYQCLSFASAAEVATANAAGVVGGVGDIVVRTPVSAGLATRRVVGISQQAQWSGKMIAVVCAGVAWVMCNAAVTFSEEGTLLSPAVNSTRTNAQTPFTNNFEMLLPADPKFTVTYQLCMADDTTVTPSTTGSNVAGYFIGYAIKAAASQYDMIPVELDLGRKYY